MATLDIYGASDDLIEVDGEISEEFTYREGAGGNLVAVSDGTLLRLEYTQDGVWRATVLAQGSSSINVVPNRGPDSDSDSYTDHVVLTASSFGWVACGDEWAKP